MSKSNNMGQILVTGITVDELLSKIEQMIDAKTSISLKEENNQSYYLSRKEVAKLLKITLPTLHDWTKLGYLKAYKIGSRVLYKPSEVKESLEKSKTFKYKKGGISYE
jgi:excisionase family DNA binding protein